MIYLVTLLIAAVALGTSSSSTPGDSALRLAQLEDAGATEIATFGSSGTYNLDEIKDGDLVFIYNIQHRYSKLSCGTSGNFDAGDVNKNQLWRLEEDETRKGLFFLVNWAQSYCDGCEKTYRFAFNGPSMNSFCYNGPKYDDQLWKFVKTTDGYWEIYNAGWYNGECGLAVWKDYEGGAGCGPKYARSFRVKPAFESDALWGMADSWENNSDNAFDHTFTFSEGITQSITQTIAHSQSVKWSLSLGIEGAVKGIGLSASQTLTVMDSFTETYQNMESKKWSVERKVTLNIPAHTTICIKQLKVNNVENLNQVGFVFSSAYYKLEQDDNCY